MDDGYNSDSVGCRTRRIGFGSPDDGGEEKKNIYDYFASSHHFFDESCTVFSRGESRRASKDEEIIATAKYSTPSRNPTPT